MTHVLVVLGSPITAEATPGSDMKQRLDRAIKIMKEKGNNPSQTAPPSLIVVTGGNPPTYGSSGIKAEGIVMKEYLVANGIPPEIILVESKSMHTFHNALYTRHLLENHGLSDQVTHISVLTHDWHMRRSMICFHVAWCDRTNKSAPFALQMDEVTVPGDPADPVVAERILKEARLIQRWLPFCLHEEAGSRSMPDIALATAKLRELAPETMEEA